jgi:hypothetical protein
MPCGLTTANTSSPFFWTFAATKSKTWSSRFAVVLNANMCDFGSFFCSSDILGYPTSFISEKNILVSKITTMFKKVLVLRLVYSG